MVSFEGASSSKTLMTKPDLPLNSEMLLESLKFFLKIGFSREELNKELFFIFLKIQNPRISTPFSSSSLSESLGAILLNSLRIKMEDEIQAIKKSFLDFLESVGKLLHENLQETFQEYFLKIKNKQRTFLYFFLNMEPSIKNLESRNTFLIS